MRASSENDGFKTVCKIRPEITAENVSLWKQYNFVTLFFQTGHLCR